MVLQETTQYVLFPMPHAKCVYLLTHHSHRAMIAVEIEETASEGVIDGARAHQEIEARGHLVAREEAM